MCPVGFEEVAVVHNHVLYVLSPERVRCQVDVKPDEADVVWSVVDIQQAGPSRLRILHTAGIFDVLLFRKLPSLRGLAPDVLELISSKMQTVTNIRSLTTIHRTLLLSSFMQVLDDGRTAVVNRNAFHGKVLHWVI